MTAGEALAAATALRPHALPAETFYARLLLLDAENAEMMGIPAPTDPGAARVLLLPPPADAVYVDYLCAVIDRELGDAARYAMDASAFDRGRAATRAAYRRSHCPIA